MTRALALLLWLRCGAWFRRMGRNARSVRGAATLVFGLLFFALVLGPNLILSLMPDFAEAMPALVEPTRRFGPLVLLGYCVLTVLFSSAEQGIVFSPAEVHLLFPAPFSRRQVLAYKLGSNALLCVVYALFLTPFLLPHTVRPLTALPGLLLTLWFIMLFSTAISLTVQAVGVRTFTRPRKVLLGTLAFLTAWSVAHAGRDLLTSGPAALLTRIEDSTLARAVLTPLGFFVDAFTAETVWPDFTVAAAWGLTINGGLLLIIFLLDAQYLEGAAAASERTYARLQRMRSGGALAAGTGAAARPRLTLPTLPWCKGVGPLAWRQLLTAMRNLRPVLIFVILFGILIVSPRFAADEPSAQAGMAVASGVLAMTVALLTPMLTFDFRGDIDRMDVLKGLPLAPAALVVGELTAPVLLLSGIQILLVGLVQVVWGGVAPVLLSLIPFGLPFNFLSFAIENLLFLWFPARLIPGAPGDFQQMGRQTLMMFAKFALLGLVLCPAALAALAVLGGAWALGSDGTLPALGAGWLVLSVMSVALVPLLVRAFLAFDVARDTPP